jgi:hypothetical protein
MIDPTVEAIKRIERLERQNSDPDGDLGQLTQEMGVIEPLLTESDEIIFTEDNRPLFGESNA